MYKSIIAVIVGLILIRISPVAMATNPIVTHAIEEEYEYILDNLRNAIIGRGMKINDELHASDMLNRTAADLGFERNVFIHATTLEFCNALISHQLVQANPNNLVLCPFTVSVYVLTGAPDTVHVAYQVPAAGPESEGVLDEIEALLRGIVVEALE